MQLDTDIRICLSLKIHLPSLMRKYYWMSKHYITFYTSFSKNYLFTGGTIPFLLVNNDSYVGVPHQNMKHMGRLERKRSAKEFPEA